MTALGAALPTAEIRALRAENAALRERVAGLLTALEIVSTVAAQGLSPDELAERGERERVSEL